MLKIKKRDTFKNVVKASVMGEDGAPKQVTFKGEFKYIPRAEVDRVVDDVQAGEIKNVDVVEQYLTGLEQVVGEDGQPMPFDEAKEAIMNDAALCDAVAVSFIEGLYGAKSGNSKRLRRS